MPQAKNHEGGASVRLLFQERPSEVPGTGHTVPVSGPTRRRELADHPRLIRPDRMVLRWRELQLMCASGPVRPSRLHRPATAVPEDLGYSGGEAADRGHRDAGRVPARGPDPSQAEADTGLPTAPPEPP